jgi:aryl-alcohol dehydrogenase-like predicted oxidoreductase
MGMNASVTALHLSVERRRFGSTDLEITPVGVGTAPIGSLPGVWEAGKVAPDERAAIASAV